tara:strand:- start:23947 stop:25242 length:1296 start_codon:yes stop_codon:yes gene_type:complete
MATKKLEIKNQNHLKSVILNRGFDPVTQQRFEIRDVFGAAATAQKSGVRFEDAMSTTNLAPLLPQTIVQIIKEAQEPLLVGPALLDRIEHKVGQTITFPAIGALSAEDVAEGQAYPEVQLQIGGATVTATINKSGLAFKFTDEVIRYSQWDILGLMLRAAARGLARHKEVKIFNYIRGMGVVTHDNVNPATSYFGTCSGRNLDGSANGAAIMDDIFDAYSQVITQGFIPDTILVHPLTWVMWIKDPVLRAFALASGGGSFFANYSGNAAGSAPWSNGPQGSLGMGNGQFTVPAGAQSGDLASALNEYSQVTTSAPTLPGYFPYPLRIIVSPFIPFDPGTRTTDIYLFDSSRLGALIVDEELTTEEWDDPSVDVRKVKLRERYGIGIYEEGQAIAVMRNVVVTPNNVILPAQAQMSVSGTIADIDHSVAIGL